jgi:general secretion pathway protein K
MARAGRQPETTGGAVAASSGFILVAVLWILAALATLAVIFSVYLANTAVSLSLSDDDIQTQALVYAALELTTYQVTPPEGAGGPGGLPAGGAAAAGGAPAGGAPAGGLAPPRTNRDTPPPPARGDFSFRLGGANVVASFMPETARIDVNAAPPELLTSFFTTLGVSDSQAAQYVQRITVWVTAPDQTGSPNVLPQGNQNQATQTNQARGSNKDEEALYRAAGKSYGPRGAPFAHIDELYLVVNIPRAVIDRAKPFLTVYTGKSQVDVLDAAPEVVAAIPGVTPNLLQSLAEARRNGADPDQVNKLIGNLPMQNVVAIDGGDTYRVQVRIRYDNGRQAAAAVVMRIGAGDRPYGILWWRDGFDALSDVRLLQTGVPRR